LAPKVWIGFNFSFGSVRTRKTSFGVELMDPASGNHLQIRLPNRLEYHHLRNGFCDFDLRLQRTVLLLPEPYVDHSDIRISLTRLFLKPDNDIF